MGKTVETVVYLILGGSKIPADGDCSHEIKTHLFLGRKAMTNLDSILKSRDITLITKVHLVKAMVFPVVMYGCENWTIKKAESERKWSHSVVSNSATPWTVAYQAPPSMDFSGKSTGVGCHRLLRGTRLVIAFLPRGRHLLISWLKSPSAVILEPKKIKSITVSTVFPIYLPWSDGAGCHDLSFLNVEF